MVIGYIFSRYPRLSETFILREMLALKSRGHQIVAAPLLRARAPCQHPAAAALAPAIRIEPWLGRRSAGPRPPLQRGRERRRLFLRNLAAHRGHVNALLGSAVFWPKAMRIAARFAAAGVEHIHAHFATHPAMAAWMAHEVTGIPFSFTAHAHDIYVHQAGLRAKAAAAAFVVAISDFNRQWILRHCPDLPPERVTVIHCGIDCDAYLPAAWPLASEPLRLLCVASLEAYKGHRYLIAACARLRSHLAFTCRLVGHGSCRHALEREIARAGLSDIVHLAGPATEDQVIAELHNADVFVLPSIRQPSGKMEGLPVALMEAMAAELPVVASDLSGMRELVSHGENGLLVPPGDSAALATAIVSLRDRQRRRQFGQSGARSVRRDFDLRQSAAALEERFGAAGRAAPGVPTRAEPRAAA